MKISLSGMKPFHVTYYGWHDLRIGLKILCMSSKDACIQYARYAI